MRRNRNVRGDSVRCVRRGRGCGNGSGRRGVSGVSGGRRGVRGGGGGCGRCIGGGRRGRRVRGGCGR